MLRSRALALERLELPALGSQRRVRYTALSANARFLALGTTAGSVFFYQRPAAGAQLAEATEAPGSSSVLTLAKLVSPAPLEHLRIETLKFRCVVSSPSLGAFAAVGLGRCM